MKTCTRCKKAKPLDQFWVSRKSRTADGYAPHCKPCKNEVERKWLADNKDKVSERNRRKYLKMRMDKDRLLLFKERQRMNELNRRARKRDAFIETVDPQVVYEMHGGMCGICKGFVEQSSFHVDHIIPLARGGMHGYVNVQPAHVKCNLSKGART